MGLSACARMHVICAPPEGERGAPLTTACCIMHQQGTLPQTPAHTPHTPGREGGREGEREGEGRERERERGRNKCISDSVEEGKGHTILLVLLLQVFIRPCVPHFLMAERRWIMNTRHG